MHPIPDLKKRVNEEWTLSIADNFKENKKQIWKGVGDVRKGQILRESQRVRS